MSSTGRMFSHDFELSHKPRSFVNDAEVCPGTITVSRRPCVHGFPCITQGVPRCVFADSTEHRFKLADTHPNYSGVDPYICHKAEAALTSTHIRTSVATRVSIKRYGYGIFDSQQCCLWPVQSDYSIIGPIWARTSSFFHGFFLQSITFIPIQSILRSVLNSLQTLVFSPGAPECTREESFWLVPLPRVFQEDRVLVAVLVKIDISLILG